MTNGEIQHGIAVLERKYGGRLGVAILDTGMRQRIAYRGDERFALCSTHKLLAAAYVLARVDRGKERLARRVVYGKRNLLSYAPITRKHVGEGGMTIGALCEAALTVSDNTAVNLLLDTFGGPAALTAYVRTLGDRVTRLDRREPELNDVPPGDPRDTTTPVAMLEDMRRIVLGNALSAANRKQLIAWLIACKTGGKRLRAGVPNGWRVGDKTGTGDNGETNDVAILWPPARPPILVAAYYAGARAASDDQRSVVLAEVGRLAASI